MRGILYTPTRVRAKSAEALLIPVGGDIVAV